MRHARQLTTSARTSERMRVCAWTSVAEVLWAHKPAGVYARERRLFARIGHFADILALRVNQNGKELRSQVRLAPRGGRELATRWLTAERVRFF